MPYRARRFLEVGALSQRDIFNYTKILAQMHGQFVAAVEACNWAEAFRLDMAFHSTIVVAASSPRVTSWHRDLLQGLRLAHLVAPSFQEDGFARSIVEHRRITLALAAQDEVSARAALTSHLENAEQLLTGQLQRTGD